jgi:integrase
MHAILRKALNQAMKWVLVERNVATPVDVPRVVRKEEAKALLAAITGNRLEALYTVALACGVRQGEALGLGWQDIDLEAATLAVRKQLQRVDGKLTLVEPKTQKSRRTLDLPGVCVTALRKHRARQAEERLAMGPGWHESGLVFTTRRGTPLDGTNVGHYFRRELAKAGIRQQRFHDLRPVCASFLLLQGVSARVVMKLLGHSQISITTNLYTHVMPSLKKDAADRMDAMLAANEQERSRLHHGDTPLSLPIMIRTVILWVDVTKTSVFNMALRFRAAVTMMSVVTRRIISSW